MSKSDRLEFDLEKTQKSEFEFKYILIALFIIAVFLKTSGCTTTTANLNAEPSLQNATNDATQDDRKLIIKTNSLNMANAKEYLLAVSIEGGNEPFALFMSEEVPYTISFVDSRHAKVLLKHNDIKNNEATVYILDGNGNTASVAAILDF